ncbi:MAG: hypothetical protein WBL65_09320 [Bryobacteraceae bacterium]
MGVEAEDIRAQVGRLIHSKTFETSEVHRHLLQYLAEKSISGEADRLKEYTIGLEAFGKPPTYDPKHDSIVRLQAGRLRQKLAAYYQTEAAGDAVRVSMPKGAFKLNFEPVAAQDHTHGAPWNPRRAIVLLAAALAVTAIWAVASTIGLVRLRSQAEVTTERWTPELESIWGPFLQTNRPLVVCLGTPLFVRFPDFGLFRDPKVNDWPEMEQSKRFTAVRKALGAKGLFASYAYTGAGEASAAFLLSELLSTRKRIVLLTRSSILSWEQIVDDDVVFVGPPKFNPQLQAAAMAQDIVIEPEGIRNNKPQPGEPVFLRDHLVPEKPSEGETHALISRTPGLSGVGDLLVIAGNASSDTLAAAEWLTQPLRARELVRRLRTPSGEFPRYFQVVVKVAFKQGIPVQSSYVFHHVLSGPPQRVGAKP